MPRTRLINGERSAAFTPLQLSIAKYPPGINWLADVEAAEGDEVQHDALEHQFRAQEHDDQVAAGHEADQADAEQDRADG